MKQRHKYEVVVEVVAHATVADSPGRLAERVRRLCPQGTYEPVRICEDLHRIVNQTGQFTFDKVHLGRAERAHAQSLIDAFKRRGVWVTR